ncbi:MAG: acyl-CoA synthetase (AMP-forming)/AMP-acid ligase II [Bermanella sp.]|jgi:acyl-CoA synthetase (AMP-forming)/AMP-acid ligase II
MTTSSNRLAAKTVGELVRDGAARWPDSEVLVFDEWRISYADAEKKSAVLARKLLAAGVGKGAHVGLLFPNSPAYLISLLAIGRIGAVAVPVSTFSSVAELQQLFAHADVCALIAAEGFLAHNYIAKLEEAFPAIVQGSPFAIERAPFLRHIWIWSESPPPWALSALGDDAALPEALLAAAEALVCPADTAAIIYTSGSTGEPKGVIHSQGNLLRQSINQAEDGDYRCGDRIFTGMPFFWVGGLTYKLLPAMQSGACILGTANGAADALLDFIEKEKVSLFLGWPYSAKALAAAADFEHRDLSAMRGGNLYPALAPELRPPDPSLVITGLGMTETAGPHTCGQRRWVEPELRGSVGWVAPGMEHRIVNPETLETSADGDLGELWVRGDTLMKGLYKRNPAEVFTVDGWYRTSDLVIRRKGHLFFEGRLDDMVKIKGVNIAPREIEAELLQMDGVVHAAVTGCKVGTDGDKVLAAVVYSSAFTDNNGAPLDDAQTVQVQSFLRERLSTYKVPSLFRLLPVHAIPLRSSGKIDRLAMLQTLEQAVLQGEIT